MPKDASGHLIPGRIGPERRVDPAIARPEYVGRPAPAKHVGGDAYDDETIERIRRAQVERYGEQRSSWAPGRLNLLVYPNFAFVGKTSIRSIWPVTAGTTEVSLWTVVPADEAGVALAERVNDIPLFQGSGGFATPDDVEALESCQAGFAARGASWTDLSKGMHRAPDGGDEDQIRSFWRQWHAQMLQLK